MIEARITSEHCHTRESLHAYVQSALGFPAYYGKNLSALADCLSEAGAPLLVTIAVDGNLICDDMCDYLLRFAQVCAREALANENVSLIIEHT